MKYFLSIVASVFILSCTSTASAQSNHNQKRDGDDHVTIYSRNHPITKTVVIKDAPTPSYTKAARKNKIEGRVTLRVVLDSWGKVTGFKPIKFLPDGLTEQAMAAAREIKFNPATIDGRPVSMRFYLIYDFSLRRGVKVIPKDEL